MSDNLKISELTEIDALADDDVLPIVDSSDPSANTKKVPISQFDDRYVQPADVIDQPLTGFVAEAGIVDDTDSILEAAQKMVGNASAVKWKNSVRVATTANGTLASAFANGQTVDGVTLITGNRILIKDQTTQTENGIYTVNASGAPTRATDFEEWSQIVSAICMVDVDGNINKSRIFLCNVLAGGTVGTNNITFVTPVSSISPVKYEFTPTQVAYTVNSPYVDAVGSGMSPITSPSAVEIPNVVVNSLLDVVVVICHMGTSGSIGTGKYIGFQIDSNTPLLGTNNYNYYYCDFTRGVSGITPGSHTIKLAGSRDGSDWTFYGTGNGNPFYFEVIVIPGGSGAVFFGNTEYRETKDLVTPFNVTQAFGAGHVYANITPFLFLNIPTTKANQKIKVSINFPSQANTATAFFVGYSLDGGATKTFSIAASYATNAYCPNVGWREIPVPSPGLHTLQLVGAVGGVGSDSVTIKADDVEGVGTATVEVLAA